MVPEAIDSQFMVSGTTIYTRGLMTNRTIYVYDIDSSKKGQQVRKGKAMLQIHTNKMKNTNCKFDLQGTFMPTAKDAEWFVCACLHKTGSGGCLGPGALAREMD